MISRKPAYDDINAVVDYYKAIADAAREIIFIVGKDYSIEYVNKQAAARMGKKPEEITGQLMEKLFPPDIGKIQKKNLTTVFQSGKHKQEIASSYLKGESVWLDTILIPLKGLKGKTEKIIGISQDITNRKQSESLLEESREKYRILVENANDGIYIRDENGNLEFVNDKFCEITGYSREELIGAKSWNLIHPEDLKIAEKQVDIYDLDEKYWHEARTITKYGELRYVDINTVPFVNSKGVKQVFGIARDITNRKLREKQQELARERFVRILNSIEAGVNVIDLNTHTIIFLNDFAHEMYGSSEGKICWEVFYKGQKRQCKKCIKEKLLDPEGNPEGSYVWEKYNERKDRWYQYVEKAIHWIDGRIVKLQVVHDITSRKNAEQALIENEAKYKMLVEKQGEGIGITNKNEIFTFANPAAEKIFGVEKGGLKDKSLEEFTTRDQFNKLKTETTKRSRGEKSTYEVEIINADGVIKCLLLTATPKYNKKGEFEGTFGIFRDITPEKKIAEALKISEERFKRFTEVTHEGIIIHKNEKIVDINPSIIRLFGYSEEEIKERNIYDFIVPKYHDRVKDRLSNDFLGVYEFEAIRKDGSVFPVEVNVRSVNIKNETYRVVSLNDITKRIKDEEILRRSEHALKIANSTKDKFFSILAHDLRSPVSHLMQFAKLLEEKYEDLSDKERREYIQFLTRLSGNTYNLLENLLTWSRIQLNRIDLTPVEFNLKGVVDNVIKLFRESINKKDLQVKVAVDAELRPYGNEKANEVVLRNLVSNAVKFTNYGGKISISSKIIENGREDGAFVNVCIKDSGVGIPEKHIDELFNIDSFYATEGVDKEKGTGLGLILCKEFVEKNGGKITVESEEGIGSTFCYTIPVKV